MNKFMFELGERCRDVYSGFEGRVVARTEYLTGCNRYSLQPEGLDKDGKPHKWETFDEMELESVATHKGVPEEIEESTKLGGPRDDIPRQRDAVQ